MSWASRRKGLYVSGIVVFFAVVIGIPGAIYFHHTPTCDDGIQNQGETDIDKGGPCPVLDERALQPHAMLWARAFRVRDGSYSATAYIQNPNKDAGVRAARYRFGLYDEQNVLVAERTGTTFVMPGAVTPVFAGSIDTGNRVVAHTYFQLALPFTWERLQNVARVVTIANKTILSPDSPGRISADAENTSVADLINVSFVAVVYDPAGNAFAASATALDRIPAGKSAPIVFTWSDPFAIRVGRVDITVLAAPMPIPAGR
jgi:hypothetical protein